MVTPEKVTDLCWKTVLGRDNKYILVHVHKNVKVFKDTREDYSASPQ